jgi:hypothetical protein
VAIRTTRRQVTFTAPFRRYEIDGEQPAGTCDIETDEEAIEGNKRTVYVRIATLIDLRRPDSTRT